jgi:hypothetical protein
MEFPIYMVIKTLVYSGWIFYGLRSFNDPKFSHVFSAIYLGLMRGFVGLGLAIVSFVLFAIVAAGLFGWKLDSPGFYLTLVLLPGRVFLWVLLAWRISERPRSEKTFWIIVGTAISTLFDIYAIPRVDKWVFIG